MAQEFHALEWLGYYLIAINLAAFVAFGIDKSLAEAKRRRISEATLHLLALVGGTPGAYAGRHLFRHKTRKQPFSNVLHAIAILQAAILIAGTAMGWSEFFALLHGMAKS